MTALAFLIAFLAGVVGGRYAWAFLVLVALGGFYLTKSDFFGYALLALIAYKIYLFENGGAKVYHGSGGIVPLPAE